MTCWTLTCHILSLVFNLYASCSRHFQSEFLPSSIVCLWEAGLFLCVMGDTQSALTPAGSSALICNLGGFTGSDAVVCSFCVCACVCVRACACVRVCTPTVQRSSTFTAWLVCVYRAVLVCVSVPLGAMTTMQHVCSPSWWSSYYTCSPAKPCFKAKAIYLPLLR